MELPKILIIDGDPLSRKLLRDILVGEAGYEVPLEASKMEEAMAAVGRIKELGINIVILDASLEVGSFENDNADRICRAIKETGESVKVIAISFRKSVPYGNIRLPKPLDLTRVAFHTFKAISSR